MANDVLNAAFDLGIRVPEELGIIGFGNLPLTSRVRPRLTTVDQFPGRIGQIAAELLLNRISGKEKGDRKNILLPTELILRDSIRKH